MNILSFLVAIQVNSRSLQLVSPMYLKDHLTAKFISFPSFPFLSLPFSSFHSIHFITLHYTFTFGYIFYIDSTIEFNSRQISDQPCHVTYVFSM